MPIQESEIDPSLASSDNEIDETHFFDHYSKSMLIDALKNYLTLIVKNTKEPYDKSMFSVFTKLFKRKEIEKSLKNDIAIEVFRAVYHLHHQMTNKIRKCDEKDLEEFLKQVKAQFLT